MRPLSKFFFEIVDFQVLLIQNHQITKKHIFFKIAHMHLKLGQMQDVRALFDEKKYFLKIPIFDVDTAIRKFSKIPHFLRIFNL